MSALLAALVLAASAHTTPVGLGMREYRFSLYRPTVHAGRVVFNMTNFGEDKHNVRLSGPHGYRSSVSPEVEPFRGLLEFGIGFTDVEPYGLVEHVEYQGHEVLVHNPPRDAGRFGQVRGRRAAHGGGDPRAAQREPVGRVARLAPDQPEDAGGRAGPMPTWAGRRRPPAVG